MVDFRINPRLKLYEDLNSALSDSEEKSIRTLISDKIPKRELDKLRNVADIFGSLEERGYIKIRDLSLIKELLTQIDRRPLIPKVIKCEKKLKCLKSAATEATGVEHTDETSSKERGGTPLKRKHGQKRKAEFRPKTHRKRRAISPTQSPLDETSCDEPDGTPPQRRHGKKRTKGSDETNRPEVIFRKRLIKHYNKKTRHIDVIPWYDGKFTFELVSVYTKLEIVGKNSRGEDETKKVDFREIFASCENAERILIEGEPGIGKSTFCRKLAVDWADQLEPILEKYEALILLELGQMTDGEDIVDAIFHQLLPIPKHTGVDREFLNKYIQNNQEKVLFVLDGADEMKPTPKEYMGNLIGGRIYPEATVIVSSRSTERPTLAKLADLHFIVKGFSEENAKKYIERHFADEQVDVDAKGLIQATNDNSNIAILAGNPLNLLLLCVLWEDQKGQLPKKLYELYESIILSIINRFRKKQGGDALDNITHEYTEKLERIGEIALSALLEDSVTFNEPTLNNIGVYKGDELLRYGLLKKEYSSSKLRTVKSWVFLHKTFQEYIAAYYLFQKGKVSEEDLSNIVKDSKTHNVCLFIAGMLGEKAEPLFKVFVRLLQSETGSSFATLVKLTLSCLQESGHPGLYVEEIAERLIRDHSVKLSGPEVGTACLLGCARFIDYCNTNAIKRHCLRLYDITIQGGAITNADVWNALRATKYLSNLSIRIKYCHVYNYEAMLTSGPLQYLQLQIYCDEGTINVSFDLSNSKKLKHFVFALREDGNFATFSDYEKGTKRGNSLITLNESLMYFSMNGQHRAELAFVTMAEQLVKHKHLKCLSYAFNSNGLVAERRKALARIIDENTILRSVYLNTEVFDDVKNNDSRRGTPFFSNTWETNDSGDMSQKLDDGNQDFYRALRQSKSLKFVTICHHGQDSDLVSVCNSLKHNTTKSVRSVLALVGDLKSETLTAILEMLQPSNGIDLLAIVGEKPIEGKYDPQIVSDLVEYVQTEVKAYKGENFYGLQGESMIQQQFQDLYMYITTLETGCESVPNFHKCVKDKLVNETLPGIKHGGSYVSLWVRRQY